VAEKEGKRYNKRKPKEKKYISQNDITTKITGLERDRNEFESARRSINRLIDEIQMAEGIDKKTGRLKIHKDNEAVFVKLTKGIYENDQLRDIQRKFTKNKKLTLEELLLWSDFLQDGFKEGQPEEIQAMIDDSFEKMTQKKYFEKLQSILDVVKKDSDLMEDVNNVEKQMKFMDDYLKIMEVAFLNWRLNITSYLMCQEITEGAYEDIADSRGQNQPLDDKMTDEILEKIKNEIESLGNKS
jgi:hypothetical protein